MHQILIFEEIPRCRRPISVLKGCFRLSWKHKLRWCLKEMMKTPTCCFRRLLYKIWKYESKWRHVQFLLLIKRISTESENKSQTKHLLNCMHLLGAIKMCLGMYFVSISSQIYLVFLSKKVEQKTILHPLQSTRTNQKLSLHFHTLYFVIMVC